MVVPIGVSADDGGMTGEVFFAEFQAKCLCLFHGQAVVGCISWVKADDILVAFDNAKWAKVHNLKQAARTLNFLTEHGIDDYAALESKVAEISAANDEAAAALKAVERRLSDMAVLIKNISTYRQTRPVALEYKKVKDKAAYRREHESQLILYEAAAKAIRDAGVTKLPNLAALKAEYRKLDEEKERLYQKYGEVKKELADYGIIKQNVDSILRVTPHQERTQEL